MDLAELHLNFLAPLKDVSLNLNRAPSLEGVEEIAPRCEGIEFD